jgi:uncharacterized protein (TIGR02594 family)
VADRDPSWLRIARGYLGVREYAGAQHNQTIVGFFKRIGTPFRDDETPWCAAFVGDCLEEAGHRSTRSAWAKSYAGNWGVKLHFPVLGCIAVFTRGAASGHVAFFLGMDAHGNIIVLGGNQSNKVSIMTYPKSRLVGFYWPKDAPPPVAQPLGLMGGDAPMAPAPEPSMINSKTGWTIGGVGATEVLRSGNEIAQEVWSAKQNAEGLGLQTLWEAVARHPGALIGLVVVGACVFVWFQHRSYKRALLKAQHGTPTVPGE